MACSTQIGTTIVPVLSATRPTQLVGQSGTAVRRVHVSNLGPGNVWITPNETVNGTGFLLAPTDQPVMFESTGELYAVAETSGATARVSVLTEVVA